MLHALVWVIAYFAAGCFYVARDMREPRWNQPGYLRTSGGRWRVRLTWPIASGIILSFMLRNNVPHQARKHVRKELAPTLAIFIAVGVAGSYLISN